MKQIWPFISMTLFLAIAFLLGMHYEQTKISQTPPKVVVHTVYDTLPAPPPITKYLPAKTKALSHADSASIASNFHALDSLPCEQEVDSLKAMHVRDMQPKYGIVKIDTIGTFNLEYIPMSNKFALTVQMVPQVREVDSVFVNKYITKVDVTWRIIGVAAILVTAADLILRR